MLAILGRCIKSKKFCKGSGCVWIRVFGWQIDDLGKLSSRIVSSQGRGHFGVRWRQLWSRLTETVGWRCTYSVASASCLQILCSAILGRMASGSVVLTKHSQVSCYRSLHLFMPTKLNTRHLHFSDLGARFLDYELRFRYSRVQWSAFGHFCLVQGQAHVGLFQLYPTSFPCHSSRHVENLQEFSCCL